MMTGLASGEEAQNCGWPRRKEAIKDIENT